MTPLINDIRAALDEGYNSPFSMGDFLEKRGWTNGTRPSDDVIDPGYRPEPGDICCPVNETVEFEDVEHLGSYRDVYIVAREDKPDGSFSCWVRRFDGVRNSFVHSSVPLRPLAEVMVSVEIPKWVAARYADPSCKQNRHLVEACRKAIL